MVNGKDGVPSLLPQKDIKIEMGLKFHSPEKMLIKLQVVLIIFS